jgi:hypothetical protein
MNKKLGTIDLRPEFTTFYNLRAIPQIVHFVYPPRTTKTGDSEVDLLGHVFGMRAGRAREHQVQKTNGE